MIKNRGGDIFADMDMRFRLSKQIAQELSVEFAEIYVAKLIDNIQKNKFGFTLSDFTIARRIQKGNTSTTPLIETGEFIKAIIQEGAEVRMMDGKHKKGLTYDELANILEFGRKDKSVPAFPVWERTFDEIAPEFRKRIRERLSELSKK